MTDRFLSSDRFRELARAGRASGAGVLGSSVAVRSIGDRTVRFVMSDGSVDRYGDTISPSGFDLVAFGKNPVVLWGHDASLPPIGRAKNVHTEGTRLIGDVQFA